MNLSESELFPLCIKDEPSFDDSYGIMGSFSITDLNEDEVKIEVKNEPVEEPEPIRKKSTVVIPVVQNPPPETAEVKPRRTLRKSNNILVSQNAASSFKRIHSVKKILTLDEIASMNGKQLVQNFSELSSNEMTKYFAYTCCLMPDVCSNFFTSFGSETDARNKMQRHITQHVKDLVASKMKDKSFVFTAEAVLNKVEEATTTKKRSRTGTRKSAKEIQSKKDAGTNGRGENATKSSACEISATVTNVEGDDIGIDFEVIDLNDIKVEAEEGSSQINTPISILLSQSDDSIPSAKETRKRKRRNSYDDEDKEWKMLRRSARARKERLVETSNPPSVGSHASGETSSSEKEEVRIPYVFDNKSSWCLDHNYDMRHYRPSREADPNDEVLDDQIQYWEKLLPCFKSENISRITDGDIPNLHFSLPAEENAIPTKLIIPILTVPISCLPRDLKKLSNNPFEECDDIELPSTGVKGYNPDNADPSSTKAGTSSDYEIYKEVDFSVDVTEEQIKEIEAMRGRWTHDHIRTLSKYYLKELEENKGKNRRRKTLCGCKICPNKKFTAITTLYYHYISHTGEKPFKCGKCDKGFTRRHSLNYHAMTHSNTNRFKCPVCLKQFRHTSHYKDHVKQHTGEDECHCKLCITTFKSKTAFNRHLKTKHNVIVVGSNKASRVMSPSKINQLHLEQEAEAKAGQNSVIIGTLESSGILSSIISNGPIQQTADVSNQLQSSTMASQSDNTLEALLSDKSFLDSELSFNIKTEPLDEPCNSGVMPANVILIQPEEFSNEQDQSSVLNKAIMRRQPRILKPRVGSKS